MNIKHVLLAAGMLFSAYAFANDGTNRYIYSVDINQVKDDKVKVSFVPPQINTDEVIFRMPKMVPGTYKIYDFGRFISDFNVNMKGGAKATVTKLDDNSWKIANAKNIASIDYWVQDTWDTDIKDNRIFEPAGTEIDEGKCFVFNNHGFFGYFEGMTQVPYEVNITRPEKFYAATGMNFSSTKNTDHFNTSTYNELVDAPIMYSVPDTTFIQVGNCRFLIAVYNETGVVQSTKVADWLSGILDAQQQFLGGKLPVDKYAFLIYVPKVLVNSGGALEHNNSSMYFMPFAEEEYFKQLTKDVAAHEFFHIVTPLTLHSDEIHYFDFTNPQMSEHLWLYEGMTEYNAHLVQVRYGLINTEQYLDNIIEKLNYADQFNDTLPFTIMSKGCLTTYEDQYINVYQKGALINMCLDILIIKNSGGTRTLRDVIAQLSAKYGAKLPFKDPVLFDEIEKITYPEVRAFLDAYVAGPKPIPYADILDIVGIDYSLGGPREVIDMGFDVNYMNYDQGEDKFYIMSKDGVSAVGKKMKLQEGDMISTINGKELKMANVMDVLGAVYQTAKPGDKIEYEILRKKNGKTKKVKVKGVLGTTTMQMEKKVYLNEKPTPEQLKLRNFWLNQQ